VITDDMLTWAEVDLDALVHNVRQLRRWVGPRSELIAIVKANAYGHGAVPVARAALEAGATRLGVSRTDEGIQLRRAGIEAPILLICYTLPAEAETVVRWRLTTTVNTWQQAQAFSAAAMAAGWEMPVHVKVDTGMGRFGLLPEEVLDFVRALMGLPGLRLEGFYTHLAMADAHDQAFSRRQYAAYSEVLASLTLAGIRIPLHHVCNSGGALNLPDLALDGVRCGIAMYGLAPNPQVSLPVELQPVMSLKTRVGRVRTMPTGSNISYGGMYTTTTPTPMALVGIGYGDGVHRLLTNRGAVLIHGQRAPIAGRVCMDEFVVDISGIDGVREDDEVVVFGHQDGAQITADEVATWAETINYEITTAIQARVPRVYLRDGRPIGIITLLDSGGQHCRTA
jgi:alanine racemase